MIKFCIFEDVEQAFKKPSESGRQSGAQQQFEETSS